MGSRLILLDGPVDDRGDGAGDDAMRLKTIFTLWLPLAVSFELMMAEGPAIQGAMGRLDQPALNLAAYGLTLSLALLIESPVIMLLATAIALVKDADTYHALRRFTVCLAAFCTLLTAGIAFTPLFDLIAGGIMRQPAPIVEAARLPLRIMLFWTAAIAWRRFYQGVLVGHGQTKMVSWGTVTRLCAAIITVVALAGHSGMPGAQVGAWALMAAVLTEAFATTLFALPVVRRDILPQIPQSHAEQKEHVPLTQRAIFRFHAPLAATTLMTLLAQPMTAAALARLDHPKATLAALPVTFMLLLVMRGWGLALQEITVAQAKRADAWPALRQFALLVGGVTALATALIVFTPLLDLYLSRIIHLPRDLYHYVHVGVGIGCGLPLVTALASWARGLLVVGRQTPAIYRGMGINLAIHATLLLVGIALRVPGMWTAVGAFTVAAMVEYLYLARRVALLSLPAAAVEALSLPDLPEPEVEPAEEAIGAAAGG